jgi:hypothetical protein
MPMRCPLPIGLCVVVLLSSVACLGATVEDARTLKNDAIKLLQAGSNAETDPKACAEAVAKLQNAQQILEGLNQNQTALAQEVNAALFWAKKFTVVQMAPRDAASKKDAGPGASAAAAAATHEVAKHLVENAAEIAAVEVEPLREPSPATALLKRRVTVTIIGAALLIVLQHIVCLVQFLEHGLGLRVTRVAVGMVLHREFAIGALQVVATRLTRHAQGGIVVLLCHFSPSSPAAYIRPSAK